MKPQGFFLGTLEGHRNKWHTKSKIQECVLLFTWRMVFVKRSCGTKPLPVALWGTRYGSKILDPRNASINSVLNMINFADSTPQFGDSCLTVRMKKLAIPEFSWILINDHIPPSLMFLHRREFKNPWTHNDFDQKITPLQIIQTRRYYTIILLGYTMYILSKIGSRSLNRKILRMLGRFCRQIWDQVSLAILPPTSPASGMLGGDRIW